GARRELRRVAERAADAREFTAAIRSRGVAARAARRRRRRREEPLEVGKLDDRGQLRRARRDVVGPRRELAVAVLLALLLERLVADTHLDVVGLAREDHQRLVLGLPAEPGDRAVVAAAIDPSADAEPALRERIVAEVVRDRDVGDVLDQAGAEYRGRNPEDDVVVPDLSFEVLLLDVAIGGLCVPGDDEEGMQAAVAAAVRVELEAGLANRASPRDERRDGILEPQVPPRGDTEERVIGRAAAARRGLGVTTGARDEVEPRPDAVGDGLFRLEILFA